MFKAFITCYGTTVGYYGYDSTALTVTTLAPAAPKHNMPPQTILLTPFNATPCSDTFSDASGSAPTGAGVHVRVSAVLWISKLNAPPFRALR